MLFLIGVTLRLFLINIGKHEYLFIPEAIVVAATIGLLLEVPHIQSIFKEKEQSIDIAGAISELGRRIDDLSSEKKQGLDMDISGDWIYEVQNVSSNYISHGGISTINVKSGEISIYGYRKYVQRNDTKIEAMLDSIPNDGNYWYTDFVKVSGEINKKIYFVYTIVLKGETENSPAREVRGYCVLTPKEESDEKGNIVINELNGTYTHLAPGTLSGSIAFKRMKKNDALRFINQKIEESRIHSILNN